MFFVQIDPINPELCPLEHIIVCVQWFKFVESYICYAPRKISGEHIVAALSVSPSVSPSVRPIRVRPTTLLFEAGFQNYFTEMTTMLRRRVARNIRVATLKVKVTA